MPDSPVLDLGFARLDLGREQRQGLAEVVYAPGKNREHIAGIVRGLLDHNTGPVLVTRVDAGTADAIRARIGGDYDPEARLLSWRPAPPGGFTVTVVGLDRVLAVRSQLAAAHAVIVIAGMEGALASVIGGLVACPVIAVPTSVGYGTSFEGITALLAMHASCAAGITVVNIDSGFGAAMAAHRIARALTVSR